MPTLNLGKVKGEIGPKGQDGEAGAAATITIGTVTVGSSNSSVSVTNSGTSTNAVLDFVIPRGIIDTSVDAVVNGVTFGRGSGNEQFSTAAGYEALANQNTAGQIPFGSLRGSTAIGYRALKSNTIGFLNTAVGHETLSSNISGSENTAIGFNSMRTAGGGGNTAVGVRALSSNAAFSNVGVGADAQFRVVSGSYNVSVGTSSSYNNVSGSYNVAIGHRSLQSNTQSNNVSVGADSLFYNTSGSDNVAVGTRALLNNQSVVNTACGHWALTGCTTGLTNSAFGGYCLTNLTTFSNCTGLGFNAQVTGSNQVQLGNSDTTAYSYGAVQNRSDLRDKADIRDTELGLDFIDALRPVDYKWDMREDYRQEAPESVIKPTEISEDASDEDKAKYAEELAAYESYVVAKDQWLEESQLANITHDGSNKRSRYHHGLIAQEVKAVLDQQGIDFGGFQDHSLKGGDDVLSIGYIELIAPMIKSIQQLKARIEQLESERPIP